MKKVLKSFALLFLCFTLSIDLVCYHFREISKSYTKEEKIYELIANLSIQDFLVDDNGEELSEVKKIKEELARAGFPEETVASILDTEKIEKEMSKGIAKSLEIVLLGKEEEIFSSLSSETILNFSKDNIGAIVKELQRNNVPKSELLTEERQKQIISKMEEIAPRIEEEANTVIIKVKEKFEDTEQYKNVTDLKNKMEKLLEVTEFVYSSSFQLLLIGIAVGCILLIVLICHSTYQYLKFLGMTSLLNAGIFWGSALSITKIEKHVNEVPKMLEGFFKSLFVGLETSFKNLFLIYFILFLLLVTANIVIHKLIESKVDKKLREI